MLLMQIRVTAVYKQIVFSKQKHENLQTRRACTLSQTLLDTMTEKSLGIRFIQL